MDLLKKVSAFMVRHRMVERGCRVVVAVSGGPDSTALLHILHLLKDDLGISLHVAHLNHMFRGRESDNDAVFVAEMAERCNLPATIKSVDVPAYRRQSGLSKQVAARKVRYEFLCETARQVGAARIALAHQADDQAETILINFLRGAGTTGLKGILPVRDNLYIRPLLEVRRAEIERYCREQNLSFRQDSSNLQPVYARNRVRLNLMPLLVRDYNPGLVPALLRLGEISREEDSFLDDQVEKAFKDALDCPIGESISLSLGKLKGMPVAIRRRALRKAWQCLTGRERVLDFKHTQAVLDLIDNGETGAQAGMPLNTAAVRRHSSLELKKLRENPGTPYYIYPLQVPGATYLPELDQTIYAEEIPYTGAPNPADLPPSEALLDAGKLPEPLFVRSRLAGDVFQPYGSPAATKLKDFFIKQKVAREERDRVPLVGTPGEIVWVGGMRTGEKWKVDGCTARVLRLKLGRGRCF